MSKIINMQGEEIKLISEHEALTYFKGKKGQTIKLKCFRQKVKRENIQHYRSGRGNRWFDEKTLLGLNDIKTAA